MEGLQARGLGGGPRAEMAGGPVTGCRAVRTLLGVPGLAGAMAAWPGAVAAGRRTGDVAPGVVTAQAVVAFTRRRAARIRCRITARAAARSVAANAMRMICQPGMPPVITAWARAGSGGCLFQPG